MQARPGYSLSPYISKFCLVFSAAYNGKHMHSQEQRKRNLWCLRKLNHLAPRTLATHSPQWQNSFSCFQSLSMYCYLEGLELFLIINTAVQMKNKSTVTTQRRTDQLWLNEITDSWNASLGSCAAAQGIKMYQVLLWSHFNGVSFRLQLQEKKAWKYTRLDQSWAHEKCTWSI